ncbi:MAG TPA: DUF885 family protein, partial [Acidimicrobiales bacterium]|nr:DUF885 family protein [Acidimicrobiales bacterium]
MSPDDLASELLDATLDADPLAGSLYGFPGYDDRLTDFSEAAEATTAERLSSIATRAEHTAPDGLDEVDHQTLDFVRHIARGLAGAAKVPMVEFTICDTFAAPVGSVFTMLPKVPLDTPERRDGYVTRMHGVPGMLATAAQRHVEGTTAGRTAVSRLVESAIAQLDFMIKDPTAGGMARDDVDADEKEFQTDLAAHIEEDVRPALAAYRDALRDRVLPFARDDDHTGICYLPGGDGMYQHLVRLHTSTDQSPDELHAIGRDMVEEVREELRRTGNRLWGTTDMSDIFDRMCNDTSLRYESPQQMLDHARR